MSITSKQQADFVASQIEARGHRGVPSVLGVADGTATISIQGVLTKKPDFLAFLFGGGNTTYEDIQQSLAAANSDPAVKRVQLDIDSPGGSADGLFETIAAIEAFTKPISVVASQAESAAFALATAAGNIQAKSPASMFGSVGVVALIKIDENIVSIASTNAPNKRPDVTTDEGKAIIRTQLDAVHELFVAAIARGRGITPSTVNSDFGRGATVLAKEARRLNMIDKVPRAQARVRAEDLVEPVAAAPEVQPPIRAKETKAKNMTRDELKASHPELFAAVHAEGVAEGVASGKTEGETAGIAKERTRVEAHLKMAESTGATKVAMDAIASGKSVQDDLVHAEYLSAAISRRDQSAVADDAADAAAAVGTAAGSVPATKDFGDEVVAVMEGQVSNV